MKKSMRSFRGLAWLVLLLLAAATFAGEPVLLGQQHVNDVSEHDTIEVGSELGTFTGLQVAVGGSAVEFKSVVIHFENGDEQALPENRTIRAGGRSRVIPLKEGPREIEKVVFYYEARSRGWRGAEIRLWGIR